MRVPTLAPTARWRVASALLAVYIIWGSTYLAIHFADQTMPPLLMAGVRFLVAGGLLYPWLRLRGVPRPTAREWRAGLVVGGLLLLLGNGGVVWAEVTVPSGVVALLVGTVPLWMAVLDWLRPGGVRPNLAMLVGLLFGFAGVALLISPTAFAGSANINVIGAGGVLVAAVCWAAGSLYSRSGTLPANPLMGTAVEMLAGGALLMVAGSALGEWSAVRPQAISTPSLLGLGYLIVFGSLIGFTAYLWLLRNANTALVSTYAYVNPVVAVLLGWALAGEALTGRTLVAAAIIVAGVIVMSTTQARAARRKQTPQDAPPASPEPAAVTPSS